jgi:hypothetical protein
VTVQKRKIVVDNVQYEWCIRGNSIWGPKSKITIYEKGVNGATLYIDPIPWEFEIRPKFVMEAIRFATKNDWSSKTNGKPMKLGYIESRFVVLPEGINNSIEYCQKFIEEN